MKAFAHIDGRETASRALADAALRPARPPAPTAGSATARRNRGATAHEAGLAAEEIAARDAARRGCAVLARRRRRAEGEIDLVLRDGDAIVFMEVKRRARRLSEDPVTPSQWRRLEAAALRYIVEAETGDAPLRFDLAVVGADGSVEVTINARQ